MSNNTPPIRSAAPFAVSLILAVTVLIAAIFGGWAIALIPFYGLVLSSIFDRMLSDNTANMDPETEDNLLHWHRMLTMIWFPVQLFFIVFINIIISAYLSF